MKMNIKDILRFIRLLSVEPLGFLTLFLYLFKKSAIDQMLQDKMCLQRHYLPPAYCHDLPILSDVQDPFKKKSEILGDVTQFHMYISICLALPIFTISLMIGPFIDKYGPAKKILFVYTSVIYLIESLSYLANAFWFNLDYRFMIFSSAVTGLSAGPLIGMTCCWSYLSGVTPRHMRSTRMIILEVFISTASPLGIALGGNLLDLNPLFPSHEPRNFSTIFLIASAGSLAFLVLSILLINEEKDKKLFEQYFPKNNSNLIETKPKLIDKKVLEDDDEENKKPKQNPMKILFDVNNVKEMFSTFVRPRAHNIRFQLILLVVAKMICQMASYGPAVFMYQYVQKVFTWNASQYSNYNTASHLINIGSTFLAAPLIIKVLKISDLNYALIGSFMVLIQNLLKVLSTAIWTFYAALPFYILNSIGSVGIQAYMTKVTEPNEVGRIFSMIGVMDSFIPLIGSVIFSNIFRATIDSKPNLAFLPVVIGMAIGIVLNAVVAWNGKETLARVKSDRARESDELRKFNESTTSEEDDDVMVHL